MKFSWLILTLFLKIVTETAGVQRTLEDVYNLLSRIDENLRKEDRMREITQTFRTDATLKNLEKQINEIARMMTEDNLGRGISSDVRSDLRTISERIEKMEGTAQSLKTMMSKIDTDLEKLEQVERITNQLERDLEHRLTKLMNAMSSLHEMNKGLNNHLRSGNQIEGRTDLSSTSVTYLANALEEMERKVKEQLSILEVQLKKELHSLKLLASNALVQCESSENEEESIEPKRDKNILSKEQIDILTQNLSRSQREIKEEFHLGIQGLERKITELSSASDKCSAESTESSAHEEVKPSCVSEQFVRDGRSCADLRKSGTTCSGIYFLYHPSGRALRIYCDMSTDGGGWSVIMRRGDYGTEPFTFHLPWKVYKHGFGDMSQEFWVGNDIIHLLTSGDETYQLRIELHSFNGESRNFTYDSFSLEDENNEYRMHVRDPIDRQHSTHFLRYNGRPFVTYDRITDQPGDCAAKYKGGWWYRRNCMYPVLTGERFGNGTTISSVGMQSQLWREAGVLKAAEMKIRPQNFHIRKLE